jgi:hypothetical protein
VSATIRGVGSGPKAGPAPSLGGEKIEIGDFGGGETDETFSRGASLGV